MSGELGNAWDNVQENESHCCIAWKGKIRVLGRASWGRCPPKVKDPIHLQLDMITGGERQ